MSLLSNIDFDFQSIRKNLSAAFVVSLIALPLGLGLAITSGVPPMAGIISVIVGGIIVSLFGGSYVTITGPGNGLVVVILLSVTSLGGADLWLGYIYTLGAIVCSGIALYLIGLFRLGNLSDAFPSATIQGLLSGIGLIIIAKQIHVLLGFAEVTAPNNLLLLFESIASFIDFVDYEEIPWIGLIGVLSLAWMFLFPRIRIKYIHEIPAPMWIVLGVIGFHFYFQYFSSSEYPIAEKFLIAIPNSFLDSIVYPSFNKIFQIDFWVIVISITLIAAIESLLSIKAIDKLDSENRRSNTNKDLKAIGIATSISGFLGGLPVVAVIARSSVNVNHSASNSSSNFFHAVFVLVFVVLFSNYLNMIPLSALAGILVYTGYRLASPAHFRKMWKRGKDQFVIYLATILGTLLFGLIYGVLIGVAFTLIVQIVLLRKQSQSFTKPFRPNTLLFQEEDGKLFLSVKGNATFLNYLNLKRKLDSIPPKHHLILDLSLTNYVDNSVMENIFQYQMDFKKKDSVLEIIGLDSHERTSNHPFAARKYLKLTSIVSKSGLITIRQQKLKEFAKEIEWKFKTNPIEQIDELESFRFFKFKQIDHAYNIFKGEHNGLKIKLMDVDFYEGELTTRERHKLTIFTFKLKNSIPEFRLDKERIFDRIAGLAGLKDISIPGHEDFSKRFLLRGKDEDKIKEYFSDQLILFFESNSYYHVESNGNSIMIFRKQRLATISEIKVLAFFGVQLIERCTTNLVNITSINK